MEEQQGCECSASFVDPLGLQGCRTRRIYAGIAGMVGVVAGIADVDLVVGVTIKGFAREGEEIKDAATEPVAVVRWQLAG